MQIDDKNELYCLMYRTISEKLFQCDLFSFSIIFHSVKWCLRVPLNVANDATFRDVEDLASTMAIQ